MVRDCDTEWDLIAKLLQLENAEAGNLTQSNAANAFYASQAVAVAAAQNFYAANHLDQAQLLAALNSGIPHTDSAAILTELLQKTEPADAQLVRGSMSVVSTEFTRPADTTAYAINDVVGPAVPAVMTFANVARVAGGSGYITNIRCVKSTTTTTNALFRLWLYNTAPVALVDNAAFTLLYANRAARLGYCDLVLQTEGAGSDSASAFVANWNCKYSCTVASRDIFAVVEAKQAYSPGNAETFFVELTTSNN